MRGRRRISWRSRSASPGFSSRAVFCMVRPGCRDRSEGRFMRVALLGVSHWHAGMHAKGVLEAGAQIAGVWDPDADAAARFIVEHGGAARPDPAAVLDDRPDLVVALGRGPEAATRLAWLIGQGIP